MLNMMKKPYYILAIPVLVCLFLPSCKMRPKDAERLRIEANTGELKSMEMLAVHGGDLITQDERNHYLDILAENGNFRALSARFSEEYNQRGKLSEKEWQAIYMRWMEKGARMGTPDCMYRLGMMYLEREHLDSTKAMTWLKQAADSCQAGANVELCKLAGKQTVLDRPRFAFRQMWKYTARDQSFLNRASNAIFHFMSESLRSSFQNLFSARWWQSLLLMLVMFGVLIAGFIYALSHKGPEAVSVAVSSIYGLLNGFALFFVAKGKSAIPGILVSSDAIGQFVRQPATYGLISDLCRWGAWCWVIIVALVYLRGLLLRIKSGQLTMLTFFKYTLGTLFSCVFFYLLAGAVSLASWVIGIVIVTVLFGSTVSDESLKKWEEERPKLEAEAAKRRQQEANRRHKRELEKEHERFLRIQEEQRRHR